QTGPDWPTSKLAVGLRNGENGVSVLATHCHQRTAHSLNISPWNRAWAGITPGFVLALSPAAKVERLAPETRSAPMKDLSKLLTALFIMVAELNFCFGNDWVIHPAGTRWISCHSLLPNIFKMVAEFPKYPARPKREEVECGRAIAPEMVQQVKSIEHQ